MLSLSNLKSTVQASQYFEQDDYYIREKGHWFGKGARELGLKGEVTKEVFEAVLNGRDPETGQMLVKADDSRRPGTDLTFSASKSVSVMAIADPRVIEAHRKAVEEALVFIERNYAATRLGAGGTEKVKTGNLVVARFDHVTSRELDPQLHTHCVAANLTQGPDGKWRTLDNTKIFENRNFLGQVYRNQLALNLQQLGYTVEWTKNGLFEIKGVDEKILKEFSQRREQVEAMAEKLRKKPELAKLPKGKLYELATLESRKAKPKELDREWLHQDWKNRVEAFGLSIEQVQIVARNQVDGQTPISPQEATRMAVSIVTETEAVFTREEVAHKALQLSLGRATIRDIEKQMKEMESKGELLTRGDGRYTTTEMLAVEKSLVTMADCSLDARRAIVEDPGKLRAVIEKYEAEEGKRKAIELSEGQRAALEHVLSSKDNIILIQGYAGVGKTFMLQTLKNELEERGWRIKGASFTGKAAQEMTSAGVKSSTIDSFLGEKKDVANGKEMWFIDEASLVGGKKALELMKQAKENNAVLVFMGDQAQLQAVQSIASFSLLQKRSAASIAEIRNINRQKEGWYQDVVKDIAGLKTDAEGKILPAANEPERKVMLNRAFEKLDRMGKIVEIQNKEELKQWVVSDYLKSRAKGSAVMLVDTNRDRHAFNEEARRQLKESGVLKKEHIHTVTMDKGLDKVEKNNSKNYAVGDIVLAEKGIGSLRRFKQGKVVAVDHHKGTVTLETTDVMTHRKNLFMKLGKLPFVDKKVNLKLPYSVSETKKNLHTIDIKKDGQKIKVYEEKKLGLAKGDEVILTKNDKSLKISLKENENGVVNGMKAVVKSVDRSGNITLLDEKRKEIRFNLKSYNYLEHGYAMTAEKSQGGSWRTALDATNGDRHKKYVTTTRGTHELIMYTTDKDEMTRNALVEKSKTSALDYMNQPEEKQKRKERELYLSR